MDGGREAGGRFQDAVKLFTRLVNIGDARSLVCHPASTTHRQLSPDEFLTVGPSGSCAAAAAPGDRCGAVAVIRTRSLRALALGVALQRAS
ncbi:hypothetical protein [Brevundimonas sp.]|uniref:hypothetical protein n=1 Tax=Brevundimonas sp. TaxID=1871086 RepID=UPI003D6D5112